MSKGGQLAIAVLSVLVAFVWVFSSAEGTFVYYESIHDMMSAQQELASAKDRDRDLRVHGFVVEGSIERNVDAAEVWFAIQDKQQTAAADAAPDAARLAASEATPAALSSGSLRVVYSGIDVPDLFADGAEVVVEGRLGPDTFTATKIMAKCPSKYENAPEGPPATIADASADG